MPLKHHGISTFDFRMILSVQNISFSYTQKPVIQNISFDVAVGQNIAILGESGCGKSTLLKLIYGLHDLVDGTISFNGKQVFGPKYNIIAGHEHMKYLTQDFDLMPYISVAENVGKYLSNTNIAHKNNRIAELLEIVEMTEFANEKPMHLSGGQQQRVAIARVLALEPKLLLLDEPFSHIDNFRKNALRRNLFAYLKNQNIACIVATHDSTDALSFSDKTIVVKDGQIIQIDNPVIVYQSPITKYVGSLFGEINEIPKSLFDITADADEKILCYPHQLKVSENGQLKVHVRKSYYKGTHFLIKAVHLKTIIFFDHDRELAFNELVLLDKVY